MIRFEYTEVEGWQGAIRGMRNALDSWDKSDSYMAAGHFVLGENDRSLALTLSKAGTDHSKYLRMITVSVDITAPTYWVSQHDTYKAGTTRNSCSFMHKGIAYPYTIDRFTVGDTRIAEILGEKSDLREEYITWLASGKEHDEYQSLLNETAMWDSTLMELNRLRCEYIESKDPVLFEKIRQLLPSGYNTRYTWHANYQVLKNIYHSRKNHRLPEWQDFCSWVASLPYSELIIGEY